MDVFVKASAGILVAVVLNLVVSKQGKDLSILITLAVCCMVAIAAMDFWRDVVAFLEKTARIGKLNHEILVILLKCVGIGVLAEITGAVCADSGNGALGKVLQLLASALILWISLPLFTELMDLMERVLGEV